jgi:MFS family permease
LPVSIIFATTSSPITKDLLYKLITGHGKATINTPGIIPQDPRNNARSVFVPSNIELRSLSVESASPDGTYSNMKDQSDSTGFASHLPGPLPGSSAATQELEVEDPQTTPSQVSKAQGVMVIVTLAGISFLSALGSGILIAALPRIAKDVGLSQGLILWPAAVYALAAGCLLLIFGAVADVIGAKMMWVTGSFLYMVFTIALGFARTGLQVILFRTFLGIAIAMCLPTAVSLITNTFPKGVWRNTAFAMNGMGQPLGYAMGLVLGGIFTDTIGWRWAYYMSAIINSCLSIASIWSLPLVQQQSNKRWTRRLAEDIDWLGATIISVALGLLFYVLAMTTSSYRRINDPHNIALLIISVILIATFPFWMNFQTKHSRPALIPNRLWKNASFTSVCISVFFCWAALNGMEYFTTL